MLKKKVYVFALLACCLAAPLSLLNGDEKRTAPAQAQQKPSQETAPAQAGKAPAAEETSPLDHSLPPTHAMTDSYENSFVKMMFTLLGLVVLIILTVWMLRRLGNGRLRGMHTSRSIKILERRPLSAKSILYLIEVGGKQILIAESQLEVRHITSLDTMDTTQDNS